MMNKWNQYKQYKGQQQEQQQEQQQQQRRSWGHIVKDLLARGIVIYIFYALISFYRPVTPAKDATGGMLPYTNIYLKDTIMVRYITLDWLTLQLKI